MDRIVRSHRFGPHQVDVVEMVDDDETAYLVLVDGVVVTGTPLPAPPGFEAVVRIYAWSRQPAPVG